MTVEQLLDQLDEHGFEDTDDSVKLEAINATVWAVGDREPWTQLRKTQLLNFNGSSGAPTNMPTDFRTVVTMSRVGRQGYLPHMREDDFEERFGHLTDETGEPLFYYFDGGTLKVWRAPAAGSGVVRLRYIYWTPELTETDGEAAIWIPKRHHREVIVNGALQKLYMQDDDIEMSREFERLFEQGYSTLRVALWTTTLEPDYIHVYADDLD